MASDVVEEFAAFQATMFVDQRWNLADRWNADDDLRDASTPVEAAAGADTHPGGEQLKHYWLHGEGAAKWSTWTELYHHLLKYLSPGMAKRTAAEWFHERFGDWPGSDTNRVRHGKSPRGHVVGPG